MQPQHPSNNDENFKTSVDQFSKDVAGKTADFVYHLLRESLVKFGKYQRQTIEDLQKKNGALQEEINRLRGERQKDEGEIKRLISENAQIKRYGGAVPSVEILMIIEDLRNLRNQNFDTVAVTLARDIQKTKPKSDLLKTKNRVKALLAKSLFAESSIDDSDKIIDNIYTSLEVPQKPTDQSPIHEMLRDLIDRSNILKKRINMTNPHGKLAMDPENIPFDPERHEVLTSHEETGAGVVISVVFPAYQPANKPWVLAQVVTEPAQPAKSLDIISPSVSDQLPSSDNLVSTSPTDTNDHQPIMIEETPGRDAVSPESVPSSDSQISSIDNSNKEIEPPAATGEIKSTSEDSSPANTDGGSDTVVSAT